MVTAPTSVPVKWNLWTHMPQVTLWEAVALVVGLEPTSLKTSPDAWMVGPGHGPVFSANAFPSRAKETQFEEAILLATRAAHFSGPIHLTSGLAVGMNKKTAMVSLREVVSFFVSCDWPEIPEQLLKPVSAPRAGNQVEVSAERTVAAVSSIISFDEVMHHLEGEETEVREYQLETGTKRIESRSFGPDRWIERAHQRQVLTALDCIALLVFAIQDIGEMTREQERQLVEGWASELRKAAVAREFQPRDVATLLPLPAVPDGWSWGLSMDDADAFLATRGMKWKCSEVAAHVFTQCERNIHALRFPPELFGERAWGDEARPAPVQASGKRWTDEAKAELAAYKAKHGTKKAASHYGISQSRVREICPSDKPAPKGYSAFNPDLK